MEGLNFDEARVEKIKLHFIYTNVDIPGHPVVFECEASDLKEADDLYIQKIGKRPDRDGSIALSII